MKTNQPFHDILFDHVFRNDIKKNTDIEFNDAVNAFKRVAVVGMLFPTQNKFKGTGFPMPDELLRDDKDMVAKALTEFSDAGIPTSPKVEFDIYNLLAPIDADLLMCANPIKEKKIDFPDVDLVIVNYVPLNAGYTPMWREYNTDDGYETLDYSAMSTDIGERRRRSVSRFNEARNIWPQACFNINAKFAVTFHDIIGDEISTDNFKGHEQSAILISSDGQKEDRIRGGGHTMGVVGNRETLGSCKQQAKKNSAIGAAVHRALKVV